MNIIFVSEFNEKEKEYIEKRLIEINMKEDEGLSLGEVNFTFKFVDNQYVVERVNHIL